MQHVIEKYSLKVGATFAIVCWFSSDLGIEFSYWVLITISSIMLPTVGATLARSKIRALGTTAGVLTGDVLAYFLGSHLAYIGLGAAVLLFFGLYSFKTNYAAFVFCVAAFLVLVLSQISHNPWQFAYWRFIDTLIGVFLAFTFSILICPCWAKKSVLNSLNTTICHLKALSLLTLQTGHAKKNLCLIEKTRAAVIQTTEKLKLEYNEMLHETVSSNKQVVFMEAIILMLERIRFNFYLLMNNDDISKEHMIALQNYCQSVFTAITNALANKENLIENIEIAPNYQLTENPYINQVIRNHISDLNALRQNVFYYLQ